MTEPTRPGALDSNDAAQYCGISREKLDRERRAGHICPRFIGSKPVYLLGELDRYLEALPSEPPAALNKTA